MRRLIRTLILLCMPWGATVVASPSFTVVPLGVLGGLKTGNLSSYLLAYQQRSSFVELDAGTMIAGLLIAKKSRAFNAIVNARSPGMIIQQNIKAILISHAHLDHIVGLVMASSVIKHKMIYGIASTIQNLTSYIFNWKIWPNLTNRGVLPRTGALLLKKLVLHHWQKIADTDFAVKPFILRHGNVKSTAFLLKNHNVYALYFGDMSADSTYRGKYIQRIWQSIIPLIKQRKLKLIMIEVSYSNSRSVNKLYGHLTPKLLIKEFSRLKKMLPSHSAKLFAKVSVLVIHIKPKYVDGKNIAPVKVLEQLQPLVKMGFKVIVPQQGKVIVIN